MKKWQVTYTEDVILTMMKVYAINGLMDSKKF
jgi:hypothetical protein